MTWLTWDRKRMLITATIILAGLAHINLFGISNMIKPITDYVVLGEIKVITIIGIVTAILGWMFYNKRIG